MSEKEKKTKAEEKKTKEKPENRPDNEPETDVFDNIYNEIDEKAEQQKPKKKRGRPSKKDKFEQEQQKVEMTAVLVQPIVSFVSTFLAARLGDKWRMSQEETKEGAKVTTALLNRYMPSFEDKAELVAFSLFWSGYVLTRTAEKTEKTK